MKTSGIILIIFAVVTCGQAYAAKYYVSTSGNNANPGTETQPWKTIQKAANTMVAGDTVYIKAGTYNERVIPQNSGSAGNYITYTAYSNDTVIIDGSGISLPYDWGGLVDISWKDYIKISGLQIQNAGSNDNNTGILLDYSSYIIIENNTIYNTTSSGIGVWDSNNITIDNNEVELACNDGEQECITIAVTDTFVVKNNHVHHSGPGTIGGEGICLKDGSSNGKVYNNHVHHLNRLGIYMDAWDKHTFNIEVYRNVVHDIDGNDCFTFAAESGGLLENITLYNNIGYNADLNGVSVSLNGDAAVKPMKDITIINNTFYNNGTGIWGGGISVENPNAQNVVIRNNIFSRNYIYQIEVEPNVPMQNLTVDHNLIHGFRDYDDEIKGSDYVEADPSFVNAPGADFHLQQNSPAIDSGSSTGAPANDYDGNTRPRGSGYDIGAFEHVTSSGSEPEISLNPTTIDATAVVGSTTPINRSFTINNSGAGTLDWSINDNASWLSVSPSSGTGSDTITVTVNPSGLSAGSYTGTITVSSSNASNSPQTVTVNLTITSSAQDQEPFGQFDTPLHGSTVRSSVPVTGWALDDVAVTGVKIYRDPVSGEGGSDIYIGDAVLVEGARPDVEAAFPGYPNNSRAGWGYMMLTNFLPNNGNGTFTLYAIASDSAGHQVTLGSKTITCDNANAVKPFGAIDTPTQGGTASGSSFINWGWVLTPMPNSIPTNGSTINVYVDSVNIGHPVYNNYRADIANLFPNYANSHGAVGYFYLDTTAYADGVHTIQWTAADNAGNTDGIGSRYFTIQNSAGRTAYGAWRVEGREQACLFRDSIRDIPIDYSNPIRFKKGYNKIIKPKMLRPDEKGMITIEIKELERVEIHLNDIRVEAEEQIKNNSKLCAGYMMVGNMLRRLPIGSFFDIKTGTFYWQPGPGFSGEYKFVFLIRTGNRKLARKHITVKIVPRF